MATELTQPQMEAVKARRALIEQIEIDKEISRRLSAKSLYHFTKVFWPVIEPGTEFVDGWHIQEICLHLEAVARFEITKLVINMPPRHMKSILCAVMFPAWVWAEHPELSFIYGSHSADLATRDSIKTRLIIQSPEYQALFQPDWSLTEDQNQKTIFKNDHGGVRKAVGVGSGITGHGGDFLFIDDPLSALEAHSELARDEANRWHDTVLSTRVNNPRRHAKVIVMQRLHEDDLTGHVLKKEGRYERLILPARFNPDADIVSKTSLNSTDPRSKKGEILWPERFDDKTIGDLETDLGDDAYAQLDQDPKPPKGGLFPLDSWKIFEQWPSTILETIQVWDCAQKPGISNDYSVCATWAKSQNGYFILDVWRDKVDTPTLEAMAKVLFQKYLPSAIVIEDKSAGSSLIQYLVRNTTLPVLPFDPGQRDKEVRATAATPTVKAGKVHLPKGALWVKDFVKEHEKFPKGKHDDQVDTTSMAVEYFSRRATIEPRIRSLV